MSRKYDLPKASTPDPAAPAAVRPEFDTIASEPAPVRRWTGGGKSDALVMTKRCNNVVQATRC